MKNFSFTFALLILFHFATAQSITNINIGTQRCIDSLLNVTFTTSGNFGVGNQFKIQYSTNFTNYVDLPTVSSASNAVSAFIPNSVSTTTSYLVRIASTNPITYSNYISTYFNSRPRGTITGSTAGNNYVDKGTSVSLNTNISGGGSYKLLLNDSTKIVGPSIISIAINPMQTFVYKIKSLSNECGNAIELGDSVKVNVVDIGFKISGITSNKICSGESINVSYDSSIPLPTNTQLQVEFINTNTLASYSFPINTTASPMNIPIPIGFPSGTYSIRIYSESPYLTATHYNITINAAPTLSISQTTQNIKFGESAALPILSNLSMSLQDYYLNIILNDSLASAFQLYGYSEAKNFLVTPTQTTTYKITKAFSNDCSNINTTTLPNITVNVAQNIYIDSLSKISTNLCVGEAVTIYYRSNTNINPADLRVKLHGGAVNMLITPTSYSSGSVTFIVPNVGYYYSYGIKLLNASNNFEGTSYRNQVIINSAITATITNTTPVVSQGIVSTTIPISLTGSSNNVLLTLSDGSQQSIYSVANGPYYLSVPVVVSESTTFSILSVQGSCGVGYGVGNKSFTINPSTINAITLKPMNDNKFCAGSSLEVKFGIQGNFSSSNKFILEISNPSYSQFTTLSSFEGTSTSITATLPTINNSYRLRVSSTSPVVRSAEFTFYISSYQSEATITQAQYSPYGQVSTTYVGNENVSRLDGTNPALESIGNVFNIEKNQPVKFSITFSGLAPFRYTLSDGSVYTTSNTSVNHTIIPTKSGSYNITSFRDGCGVGTTRGGFAVNIQPLFIKSVINLSTYCLGSELKLPYLLSGEIPTGMTLKAKISESNSSNYQELPTRQENSSLYIQLPTSLQPSRQYIQLFVETPTQTINSTLASTSNSTYGYQIDIKPKPTVALSEINGMNPVYISNNSPVSLRAIFGSQPNYSFLLSNNVLYTSTSNNYIFSVAPNQDSLTYFIKEVSNQCGYGLATGSVKIIKKPSLASNGVLKTLCSNETFNFLFFASGLYGANNIFKFYLTQGTTYKEFLGETNNKGGYISLTLPANLSQGNYNILIETTDGGGIFHNTAVSIAEPIKATLSGNTTVNPNEQTYLKVSFDKPLTILISYNYSLSNGQSGIGYGNPFYIMVSPSVPTNYLLSSITGGCGVNTTAGSAFVNVNPASNNTISTNESFKSICAGKSYSISYTTNTSLPNTLYKVQLSDKNGENFVDIPTTGTSSPLLATIPNNLEYGENYRLRVVSDSYGTMSGANLYPLTYAVSPTVSLTTTPPVIERNAIKNIELNFTGTPTWSFQLKVGNKYYNGTATTSPYYFNIAESAEGNTLKLVSVSNSTCGIGNVLFPDSHTFCPPNINVTQPIINNESYTSGSTITARSIISNGSKVIYDAKQSIILNAGFKADFNTVFETKLEGCNN